MGRRVKRKKRSMEVKSNETIKNPMTTTELAERWRMSAGSLANMRVEGTGPRFIKPGKIVLYPLAEVEAFEQKRLKRNTV